MDHAIHAHRTVCIHTVACVHANIVRIVTHAVWYAFQRFVSAIFAIVDTGNVVTTNQHTNTNTHTHMHTQQQQQLLLISDRKM